MSKGEIKLKRISILPSLALVASATFCKTAAATDSLCISAFAGGTLHHVVYISESEYNDSTYLGVFADADTTFGQDYKWGVAYKRTDLPTHHFVLENAPWPEIMHGSSALVTIWNPYGDYHAIFSADGETGDMCECATLGP